MIWAGALAVIVIVVAVSVRRSRRRPPPSATSLYIGALDALLAGDEARGLDLLRETVRSDSNNVGAYIRLGTLLRLRGDPGRATRIHREISLRPGIDASESEQALMELALDYTAAGNTEKSLSTLEELRNLNKKSVFAYEAAAQLTEDQGNWESAYEFRKQLQRLAGDNGAALARFQAHVGRELAGRGDRKSAKDHFKEAFRKDKHSLAACIYSGDLKYQDGKLQDAVELWKKVIQHHPDSAPWVYRRLEKAYFDLGHFETMMDVYDEVLKEHPNDVTTLLSVAQFHRKKGDLDEAEEAISRILENDPEEPLARLYMGLIRAEQGRNAEASDLLGVLLEDEMEAAEMFVCARCGHEAAEILWRCPDCGGWETFIQESS
ncbi:MAG: tetratricopeptide repeat protein [Candidatus Eisenbacteria sp.]|nr:tetratricopeptide repeat protein [Candidatus Eisenbacteria bacterium]